MLEQQKKDVESSLALPKTEMEKQLRSFYTPKETASRLSVSPKTVINEVNRGKLVGTQLGTQWYVLKESVESDVRYRD